MCQISRAPDMVLYPQSHEEVERIVALAHQHCVLLVPYGGMESMQPILNNNNNKKGENSLWRSRASTVYCVWHMVVSN